MKVDLKEMDFCTKHMHQAALFTGERQVENAEKNTQVCSGWATSLILCNILTIFVNIPAKSRPKNTCNI